MIISQRASKLTPSATLAISARAKELQKEGKDVLDFGLGEPDFPTPKPIVEATIESLKKGRTRYSPASGTPELKQEVANYYKKRFGLDYTPENVSINDGAKHSLYNIFQALVGTGDEVILPAPYWVSYYSQIILAEAAPVIIEAKDEADFKITAQQLQNAITNRTKLLVINSPSNPTGSVYSKEELIELANICVDKGIYIIYDEVYEHIIYGMEHVCLAALSEKIKEYTILVNAVSKTFCMTGFRIGYTLSANKDIIKAINNIQSHSTSNPVTFAMDGALYALKEGLKFVPEMRKDFEKRMLFFADGLNSIDGITCVKPKGAFYVFPNVSGLLNKEIKGRVYKSSLELCKAWLEDLHIASVAGEEFGAPGCIRFSYAASIDTIEKALTRIKDWVK